MSKFIRTNEGIYELKENMTIEKGVYNFFGKIYNTAEKHLFRNDKDLGEFVSQADTIKELCDEFVHGNRIIRFESGSKKYFHYLGDDFVMNFIINEAKKEDNEYSIKIYGIFFEINPLIGKIFILSESSELLILNSNFYHLDDPNFYQIQDFGKYKLPNICLFDKLKINNNNYYVYNIKYSFSSFPVDIKTNSNNPIPYLYSNQYIINSKTKNDDEKKMKLI